MKLTVVHEVENTEELLVFDPFQVEKRVLVWVELQHFPKELTTGRQNNFVCHYLGVLADKG